MTVNERLYISGLIDTYDQAIKENNRDKIISILSSLEINEKTIEMILQNLGLPPFQQICNPQSE